MGQRAIFSNIRVNFFLVSIVFLLAFVLPSYAHAGLAIKFKSEVVIQATSDSNPTPAVKKTNLSVFLEDSYFHFIGEEEKIYDFDKKIIYSIDRDKSQYTTTSLFSNVGFRDYELQNRKFISGALESAGVEGNPMPMVFSEHELSIQTKDTKSEIKREEDNGNIVFVGSGKDMLKMAGPVINIPQQYRKQFVRFFRHRYGGHPSIIDEIVTSSGIYKDITIWHINVTEKKIHLHLESITETSLGDYSLEGLKENTNTNNRLLKLAGRVGDSPLAERKRAEEEILANAENLIKKNDLVGAMLAYLEYTLVSGSQNIPWKESDRALLINSDHVKKMLAATRNPTNRDDAVSKISAIEVLRKKQNAGVHILKIFEANTRASVGETTKARDLLMEALEVNPYIAGAWKDLGGLYFQSYEPYEAWVCWDTGRDINPDHPLLKGITSFENQLQAKHPDFF